MDDESITAQGDNYYFGLNFQAKQVYLVLSESSETPVQVYFDDRPAGQFVVDRDKKHYVVRTYYGKHDLSLKIPQGISAYTFTFSDVKLEGGTYKRNKSFFLYEPFKVL